RRERVWNAAVPGARQARLELLEATLGDIRHQGITITKMTVGRGRADAGLAGGFCKREAGRTLGGDQVERGADQCFAQIAVMITAPSAAAWTRPAHGASLSAIRASGPSA